MAEVKIGIVGLDTSHCKAFTSLINDTLHPHHISGGRVTCAYPGGSEKFSLSRNRLQAYTRELRDDFGIEMLESIPELAMKVDAILLESVDGRQHLEQFRQLAIGKPVFIDKPLATSFHEAYEIQRIAVETNSPLMSCSSLRYASGITNLVPKNETITSCVAFGPAALLDDYPGLFWYGIHSAEILYSYMGVGCQSVRLIEKPDMDIVIGEWKDGRVGVVRGTRFTKGDFGCVIHTSAGTRLGIAISDPPYYSIMLKKTMDFFRTGVSPIPIKDTLEIIAFLEAAEISRHEGGNSVKLAH
jgi:hypothetical protein